MDTTCYAQVLLLRYLGILHSPIPPQDKRRTLLVAPMETSRSSRRSSRSTPLPPHSSTDQPARSSLSAPPRCSVFHNIPPRSPALPLIPFLSPSQVSPTQGAGPSGLDYTTVVLASVHAAFVVPGRNPRLLPSSGTQDPAASFHHSLTIAELTSTLPKSRCCDRCSAQLRGRNLQCVWRDVGTITSNTPWTGGRSRQPWYRQG